MTREPLLKKSLWVGLVSALIALAIAVGLPVSDQLKGALIGLISAAWPIVTAIWARGDVTPVDDPRDADGQALVSDEGDY